MFKCQRMNRSAHHLIWHECFYRTAELQKSTIGFTPNLRTEFIKKYFSIFSFSINGNVFDEKMASIHEVG